MEKRAQVDELELDRAATEADDQLQEARLSLELAANTRKAKVAGLETSALREQLELEQLYWRQQQEREQAARQQAAEVEQRKRRAAAEAAAALEQQQLRARERDYVTSGAGWAKEQLGEWAILEATRCVKATLSEFALDDPDEIIEAAVGANLARLFEDRIRDHRQRAREKAKADTRSAVLLATLSPNDPSAVRAAVEDALDAELESTQSPENNGARLEYLARRVRNRVVEERTWDGVIGLLGKIAEASRR